MSVYRKESNSLVPKAGLGIIDNIFNRFSNHAISNAKTTEALILRNVMYDESDGKLYKVGIDGTKGEEIKMARTLDYSKKHSFANTTYVTPNDGVLFIGTSSNRSGDITIDGVSIYDNTTATGATLQLQFELPLKSGTTIVSTYSATTTKNVYCYFVPYAE